MNEEYLQEEEIIQIRQAALRAEQKTSSAYSFGGSLNEIYRLRINSEAMIFRSFLENELTKCFQFEEFTLNKNYYSFNYKANNTYFRVCANKDLHRSDSGNYFDSGIPLLESIFPEEFLEIRSALIFEYIVGMGLISVHMVSPKEQFAPIEIYSCFDEKLTSINNQNIEDIIHKEDTSFSVVAFTKTSNEKNE